jgi:hypothetical protein
MPQTQSSCGQCGAPVYPELRYCGRCGGQLAEAPATFSPQQQLYALGLGVAAVVAFAFALTLILFK